MYLSMNIWQTPLLRHVHMVYEWPLVINRMVMQVCTFPFYKNIKIKIYSLIMHFIIAGFPSQKKTPDCWIFQLDAMNAYSTGSAIQIDRLLLKKQNEVYGKMASKRPKEKKGCWNMIFEWEWSNMRFWGHIDYWPQTISKS